MIAGIWDTVVYEPVMNALLFFYAILGENLGLAIIVFTIIIRLILFPLMRSQFASSRKLKAIQPQLEKIRKKYKRNPQKQQEEQLKLYRKEGYNPAGCLVSTLLPFPLLIAIYQAIRAFSNGDEITGVYPFIANLLENSDNIVINAQFFIWDLSQSYMPLAKELGYVSMEAVAYLVLALLTGVSQYFSVKLNQNLMGTAPDPDKKKDQKKKKKDDDSMDMSAMMGDMGKSMTFTFPLMTTFIALSTPSGVALYWIVQSWASVILFFLYDKFMSYKDESKKEGSKKGKK